MLAHVSPMCLVSACSDLYFVRNPSLVGTIPDTITSMTTLRFVGGHPRFVSVVHATTSAAMSACDLPCVAETWPLKAAASREPFRLASATLSGLRTSPIRHECRGQQCVCVTSSCCTLCVAGISTSVRMFSPAASRRRWGC
jgi:hypothetical protein